MKFILKVKKLEGGKMGETFSFEEGEAFNSSYQQPAKKKWARHGAASPQKMRKADEYLCFETDPHGNQLHFSFRMKFKKGQSY